MKKKFQPHLNNVLTLPSESENITFHTFIMHSLNITCYIKHGVKQSSSSTEKTNGHHKVCLKCLPLA